MLVQIAAIQPGAITMCLFSTPLYLPLLLLMMASTRVITSIVPDWSLLLFQNDKVKFCKQVVCSWNSVTSLTMTLPMSLLSCSVLKLKPLLLLEAHVANIRRILNGNTRSYPGHVWSPNGPPWGAESGLRALFISTTLQHHTTKTLELYNIRTLPLWQYQDCTIHTPLHSLTNRAAKWKGTTRPGHLTWVEEENDVGSFCTHHAFQETWTRRERGMIERINEILSSICGTLDLNGGGVSCSQSWRRFAISLCKIWRKKSESEKIRNWNEKKQDTRLGTQLGTALQNCWMKSEDKKLSQKQESPIVWRACIGVFKNSHGEQIKGRLRWFVLRCRLFISYY